MIMRAQGVTMPSLSFEMLRVATGTGTILIKADKAGIKIPGLRGLQIPTDRNGQLWMHYARPRPLDLRLGPSTCSMGASRRTGSRASLW